MLLGTRGAQRLPLATWLAPKGRFARAVVRAGPGRWAFRKAARYRSRRYLMLVVRWSAKNPPSAVRRSVSFSAEAKPWPSRSMYISLGGLPAALSAAAMIFVWRWGARTSSLPADRNTGTLIFSALNAGESALWTCTSSSEHPLQVSEALLGLGYVSSPEHLREAVNADMARGANKCVGRAECRAQGIERPVARPVDTGVRSDFLTASDR